jgi:hypothetical protein
MSLGVFTLSSATVPILLTGYVTRASAGVALAGSVGRTVVTATPTAVLAVRAKNARRPISASLLQRFIAGSLGRFPADTYAMAVPDHKLLNYGEISASHVRSSGPVASSRSRKLD